MKSLFRKSSRLLRKSQFDRVKCCSKKSYGKLISINFRETGQEKTRIGLIVTKRYGNACKRNRFKRLIREAFRLNQHTLPQGLDIIIRPAISNFHIKQQEISEELLSLLVNCCRH